MLGGREGEGLTFFVVMYVVGGLAEKRKKERKESERV